MPDEVADAKGEGAHPISSHLQSLSRAHPCSLSFIKSCQLMRFDL